MRYDDFFAEAAKWIKVKNIKVVKQYWEGFLETIVRNMYLYGRCEVPGIGVFVCKHIPEGVRKQHNKDGQEIFYYIPEHDMPHLKPCDDFINDINMDGVTGKYRQRLKNQQLNASDIARVTKKEALAMMKQLGKTIKEGDRTVALTEFEEMLKLKKEQYQKKIDNESNNQTEQ